MTKKNTLAGLIILVAGSLLIAACSGAQATPAAATVDANAIYTQAAQTVQAQIAQTDAAKPPTATFTATVAPTNTTDPSIAAGMTATANAVLNPSNPTATATTAAGAAQPTATTKPAVLPTATTGAAAKPPSTKGDKAELISQSPNDGTKIQKEASFDMSLVIKNVGTTTWTTKYALVFYAGERMDSPADYFLQKDVKPGESVKLVFPLKAPKSIGEKTVIWAMRNADGTNFYPLYLTIQVTD